MAKKPRSHKHSLKQRSPKPKTSNPFSRRRGLSVQVITGVIAFALLAGGSLAQWREMTAPSVPDKTLTSAASLPARPANAMADELPSEPPMIEPPMVYPTTAGYNAYTSGGLPPGALPPGVVLPTANRAGSIPMNSMMPATATQGGYGVYDGIRQQFTAKERDNETGLDYFGARYYSPTQGRFTSVDPENAGADPSNPQSWNGYSYALNNPLKYQDPDGRKVMVCDGAGKNCHEISDKEANYGLFNKDYISSIGYTVKNNKIFDEQGNLAGTYRRTSFDDWSDFQNGVVFGNSNSVGLVDQAPAAGRAALAVAGTGAVLGTGLGGAMYATGGLGAAAPAVARALPQFSQSTIEQGVRYVMSNSAKVSHIFAKTQHNLQPLVSRLGGQENTIRTVLNTLNGQLPAAGRFERVINIAGQSVVVRGNVVNGVTKIGTMFVK